MYRLADTAARIFRRPVCSLMPEPVSNPEPASPCPPGDAAQVRTAARIFVEDVVQGSIKIPLVDTEAAEALVAGIFDDPHAPLPQTALAAGWRSDLADMAYASSQTLRASRFAGLDPVAAETAFNEVVQGYALGPTEFGLALRLVLEALSGSDGPETEGPRPSLMPGWPMRSPSSAPRRLPTPPQRSPRR